MKWFKHMTDSLDDPFIHDLMDEFGATGYLAFFGLIEIIGKENGHNVTGKLSVSPTYLRRKLRTSQGKLRQVYDFCQTFGKLSVRFSEKLWEFEFIKMAEIKDNYTRDLEVADKKLSLEEEVEVEEEEYKEEVEGEGEIPPPPKKDLMPEIKEIIDYLNTIVGTSFRATTKKTKELIKVRLSEGFSIDDFKTVIDKKFTEWGTDEKMSAFLRPETLFGNKFEGYLNQQVKEGRGTDKTKGNYALMEERKKKREEERLALTEGDGK